MNIGRIDPIEIDDDILTVLRKFSEKYYLEPVYKKVLDDIVCGNDQKKIKALKEDIKNKERR